MLVDSYKRACEAGDVTIRACRCALAMITRLKELQAKWAAEGKYVLDIGIGINTGGMVVGNMGAPGKKMDYTVIGDNVNLGARLEGMTRQYNNHNIMSECTYAKVKHIVAIKELGTVTVKGKQLPVMVYGRSEGIKKHLFRI